MTEADTLRYASLPAHPLAEVGQPPTMPKPTDNQRKKRRIRIRQDISPLRYPGGKRKLLPLIEDLLHKANLTVDLLVEPFAGGAAVSIGLLEAGIVRQIALADKDYLIASFWKTVFSRQASNLAELVLDTPITLAEWRRQRNSAPRSTLRRAFQCLFLNRTNFSGSICRATGPIGGVRQAGEYKINCRFNQERIANRLMELSRLKDRVDFVRCQDWRQTLRQIKARVAYRRSPESVLFYLDPPFFAKADLLYRQFFSDRDHRSLAAALPRIKAQYILSYDDHPRACDLYSRHPGFARVNLQYNARIDDRARIVASEVLVSNIVAEIRRRGLIGQLGCVIPLPQHRFSTPDTTATARPLRAAG